MNRIIALLFAALFAGCANRPPPSIASGPVNITGFDAAGHQTITSYAGRTAAGGGQVNDTASAAVLIALAEKIKGNDFTFAEATRSAVVQPDAVLDSEIETKHKAALSKAGAALAAGATGDYSAAVSEIASLGGQLIAARSARANAPKPDSGAISTRILSSGEGHAEAAQVGIRTFGETIQAAKRATFAGTSKTSDVDTTTPADIDAITAAIREARLALQKPVTLPGTGGVIQVPVPVFPDPVTPPSTNTVETIRLPELPQ